MTRRTFLSLFAFLPACRAVLALKPRATGSSWATAQMVRKMPVRSLDPMETPPRIAGSRRRHRYSLCHGKAKFLGYFDEA